MKKSSAVARKPKASKTKPTARPAESLIWALEAATLQAERVRGLLKRIDVQKMVLDQHAVVSECDASGVITYVNDALCKISGYTREELIGKSHGILNSEQHSDQFWQALYETVITGGVWQSEVCNRRKDGSEFWLIQTIAAVRDDDGQITGYVDIGADITETKKLQKEFVRRGKLAQLGQLTTTVAHEIRNPLGSIRTATQLIERKTRGKGLDLDKSLERINNGIARCDLIITELLEFSRPKTLQANSTAVDKWVRSAVAEEAIKLPREIAIKFDLGLGNAIAPLDTDHVRRVIGILLANAAEAMVGKGAAKVANPTQNPQIQVTTRKAARNIEIVITDNGPGISEEHLGRITEPLFTTKPTSVGLGLPLAEQILELHGGGLRAESKAGGGATITFWIPTEVPQSKRAKN